MKEIVHVAVWAPRRDAFQFYVAQDAHFLAAFANGYQAAMRKAALARDSDAEKILATLLHGVSKELEMHASYAKVPNKYIMTVPLSQQGWTSRIPIAPV